MRRLSKWQNIRANIPFNNGKILTSFCKQRLYLPIKHKGWNSHVEPHFRRQATFFGETSHSQLKWLWLFFFPFLGGFDWGYQQALDKMNSHMTHLAIWWKEKEAFSCRMPTETTSSEIRVHGTHTPKQTPTHTNTQNWLACIMWDSWNEKSHW